MITEEQVWNWVWRLLWIAFILCCVGMGISLAFAHDYARPELKSWFMGLHNSQGSPCCDGNDAVHIEDADWSTSCEGSECHYKVHLEGKWYDVPPHAVVDGPNKSGTALVWPVRYGILGGESDYVIRCFMPGTQG